MIRKAVFLFAVNICFSGNLTAGFCERLFDQTSGFDVFKDDEDLKDREHLGDAAIGAGIHYLAVKVPISELANILGNAYLLGQLGYIGSEPQILEPIGSSKIGEDISARLGGLNVRLSHDEPYLGSDPKAQIPIVANPNRNAFLLYTPRIFSLTPWTYGNNLLVTRPQDFSEPGQLCAGWSCVTSNSSDAHRIQAFRDMAQSDSERWVVRADGPLPRYEILGILTQPSNQHYVNAVLDKYPGLSSWKNKLLFQTIKWEWTPDITVQIN
jgi:hypothetical protein